MIGLDTSVLVRYLVRDDERQFAAATRVMSQLSQGAPGFVTQVTLVELYWVLSRTYAYPRETCLSAMSHLVASSVLEFEDGEGVVRALTAAESGADFADALIASSLELFGVGETVTFDRRAARDLGWRLLAAE